MNSYSPVGLVSRQWDDNELVYCVIVVFTDLLLFNGNFSFEKKPEVAGSQIWAVGVLTNLGDVMLCQKHLHESCRMGRNIVVMKLICLLGHCECDDHTVHKLSQWHLAADWLAPQKNDCSQMDSKVSAWLPSYIKATRPVLEIFSMAGYFSDRPCTHSYTVQSGAGYKGVHRQHVPLKGLPGAHEIPFYFSDILL